MLDQLKVDRPRPRFLKVTAATDLIASHSLEGNEVPHHHRWKISVSIQKNVEEDFVDRIIDFPLLEKQLHDLIAPLQHQYLNRALTCEPTCERLTEWIWNRFPQALNGVEVEVCSLEGQSFGSAKLSD